MFHKRIASELRSHFSTVGPSPSPERPPQAVPHDQPGLASRLTLVPASGAQPSGAPATPLSPSVLSDLIRVGAPRCSAFFAEAAVLVLVLGVLDRFLAIHRLEPRWLAGTLLVSLLLLATSVAMDLTVRRWSRPT